MSKSNRRILITGAGGFIGGYLYRKLRKQGAKIKRLRQEDWPKINTIVKLFHPTEIYHFAAYGNQYGQQDIFETYEANLFKLLKLLGACQEIKYKSFINVGSSSEYGEKNKPMNEKDFLEPDTYYAASKAAGTLLSRVWAIQKEKPVVTVRPFTVTGVGEQQNHLIPTLIRSCLSKEKMKFVKDPVHDFIDVDDFVRGVLVVAKHADKYKGEVFNIGSGKQYTNEEVRIIVERVAKRKANIEEVKSLRTYDTSQMWLANNTKIRKLGWKPKKSLRNSIEEMVKDFKKKIKNVHKKTYKRTKTN